ncbi:MAG: FtsL-like putative cell division protein [Bacteroidaceae bacterium]|nr:FtsL-like putative cell division protein [Bacteroidaceae bacterium]
MLKKKENPNLEEELRMALLEDTGAEHEDMLEDQEAMEAKEAMEAMRKFTAEDEDEMGEISIKSILGGDFLMSKFVIKQIMFVIFCVALMILYTANRYDSQQDAILIDSLRNHLQDVKYNVLTQSSELMNLVRQSNVEKKLRTTDDSLLHNSITPPFLIKMGDDEEEEERGLVEVVVDQEVQSVDSQKQKEQI